MMRRIGNVLLAVLFAFTFFLGAIPFTFASAEGSVTLTFHYHRYAKDYTNWDIWVWEDGADGQAIAFSGEDDYGKIAKATVSENAKVGFIVRRGNWLEKDVSADRFVTVDTEDKEIWLIQGDSEIYGSIDEADISPKLLDASFSSTNAVKATVTAPVTADNNSFTVKADGVAVEAENTTKTGSKTVTLILTEGIDFTKTYTVCSDYYGDKVISMENLFGTADFESVYAYDGDLGALYTATKTIFRLWTPLAESVKVNLYATGSDGEANSAALGVYDMTQKDKGVWEATVDGDLKNVYYTYTVKVQGVESEVVDPYAKAAGVNGNRGMVVDLDSTDPTGWENVTFLSRKAADSIIYEAHVRDLTIDPSSGVSEANRGKFLGMTETGTKNSAGQSTALDHLIELGVTELHILPIFDYKTVDESSTEPQFNWGYDPMNYNVPEGSYSTNPYDGNVRIKELKEMVLALHNAGIRVVMDVVYNHTADSANSNFNLIMPGYYYRMVNGNFSNGSGCGNETASERAMYRKFMIDSVCYWAEEFKIDGFRFDLMGLHDVETMNLLAGELRKINPDALLYGEGWTGGTSGLAESKSALKKNAKQLDGIAVFSDDIRDSIKGSVFEAADKGFISGKTGLKDGILFGVYGASKTVGGYVAWASDPTQSINYASAHDNLTLADKIASSSSASAADRAKMTRLSAAIVLTSQGIPFFQAGEEMLRSKVKEDGTFDENSYKSSDAVNSIKWDLKSEEEYSHTFEYYKGLIALRKAFPEFRLDTKEAVTGQIWEMTCTDTLVSYYVESENRDVIVAFNASTSAQTLDLGLNKTYQVFVDGNSASAEAIDSFTGKTYEMQPLSACVLVREKSGSGNETNSGNEDPTPVRSGCGGVTGVGSIAIVAAAGVAAAAISKKKRK